MKLQVKENAFLSNYDNKNRLTTMLKHLLVSHNINVVQAEADADYLLANTCLDLSVNNSVLGNRHRYSPHACPKSKTIEQPNIIWTMKKHLS